MEDNKQRGFDVSLLKDNIDIISSNEALKDVIPIAWSEEVLTGKIKALVGK